MAGPGSSSAGSPVPTGDPAASRAEVGERLTVAEVAARYIAHAERRGRKKSTCENVESVERVHLTPFLGERALDAIEPEDVIDLVALLERKGRAPATVRGVIATLSALIVFARGPYRRWAVINQTIYRDDDDLVFAHPDYGGVLPKANISRRFCAALRAAGLEDHRFHDLRYTFGTRMAAAGVALRTLQEWMGSPRHHHHPALRRLLAQRARGGRWSRRRSSGFRVTHHHCRWPPFETRISCSSRDNGVV